MLNIPTSYRVALLIDADNAQLNHLQQVIKFSDTCGVQSISRAYGDWKQLDLSPSKDEVAQLNIDIRQVDRIAKDTADKQLMIEAGEILGADDADIYIIVSGDGDFRLLCERIKQKGRKVIGIGNRGNTSEYLKKSCDEFHYIEDLEETLIQLEKNRLQEFETLLFRALDALPRNEEGWVNFGPLGTKLRELNPEFDNHFGRRKLSEWLSDLNSQFEVCGQQVRIIDSAVSYHLNLLRKAYIQVKRSDGRANIGQMGQVLRKLDLKFESHFGKKKLSSWLDTYPHIFNRNENHVDLI